LGYLKGGIVRVSVLNVGRGERILGIRLMSRRITGREGKEELMKDTARIQSEIWNVNPEMLFADGFDEALIGTGDRFGFSGPVAVYDMDKCFEILVVRDGMEYEEAVEYFEFNVIGAWVGDGTPIFVRLVDPIDD